MNRFFTNGLSLAIIAALSAPAGATQPTPAFHVASQVLRDVRTAVTPSGETIYHAAACGGARFHCKARVRTDAQGHPLAAPRPGGGGGSAGYGPADLKSAYALDTTLNPNATVAVVDAYGYANAESDLASYRSTYGLPACTVASGCLTIVDQTGGTNLPGAPPSGDDWTVETALDLDMASAGCPSCKLLLIQATDDQGDGLDIAQAAAAKLGATVVSNSWGGTTAGADAMMQESYFNLTPSKMGIFVAAGDDGYDNFLTGKKGTGPDYPSTSEFVIAVGGTNLVQSSSGGRGWTEAAWGAANGGKVSSADGAGGSSCSDALPIPTWQMGVTTSCKFRAASDVAAVGDPATGVAVFNQGSGGMIGVGGTSAASPLVASIFALYGHGQSKGDFVYNNPTAWNDVTTGINGTCGAPMCQAGTGWDGPTGLGTPNGAALGKIAPGDGNGPPPDMATPPDMTSIPDLSTPPDLSTAGNGGSGGSGGGGAGGSGGGTGGNGNNGGNGGNGSSGCSIGGSVSASGFFGLAMLMVVFALIRRRRDA